MQQVRLASPGVPVGSPYTNASFVALYNRVRPKPPKNLTRLLTQLVGGGTPSLVIDLGSGTGLSTVAWAGYASQIIGIESNPEMMARARRAANVTYRQASADATGLKSGSADIVTCSQSFHWMNRRPAIAEIARIMRRGAVFAAYDYSLPPFIHPALDEAFDAVLDWSGLTPRHPPIERYLKSLQRSGRFRGVRSFAMESAEVGDAKRVIDLATSLGSVADRLENKSGRRSPEWKHFVRTASRTLGHSRNRFWWTYSVVLATK
jgi:SAM-dependent methyltransferase